MDHSAAPSVPARLYRYLDSDGGRKTLFGSSLKVTPPLELNDPFEMSPSIRISFDESKARAYFDEKQDYFRRKNISYESYCKMVQEKIPAGERKVAKQNLALVNENYGVICFTKRLTSIPMWSYYSKSHTGLVLEFDSSSRFFSQLNINLREVVYSTNRAVISGPVLPNELEFLYTKCKEWEHEEEVRLIVPLELCLSGEICPSGRTLRLLAFNPSALTGIYLGSRFTQPDAFAKEILNSSPNVPVFQMQEDHKEFAFQCHRVTAEC